MAKIVDITDEHQISTLHDLLGRRYAKIPEGIVEPFLEKTIDHKVVADPRYSMFMHAIAWDEISFTIFSDHWSAFVDVLVRSTSEWPLRVDDEPLFQHRESNIVPGVGIFSIEPTAAGTQHLQTYEGKAEVLFTLTNLLDANGLEADFLVQWDEDRLPQVSLCIFTQVRVKWNAESTQAPESLSYRSSYSM